MLPDGCDLTGAILQGITSDSSRYHDAILTCTTVTIVVFITSTLSKNFSQIDKLWSIIPAVYAWIAVVSPRTLLMATVATVWGMRLTYNFWRRGGYSWPPWEGEEDYRWEFIRRGHYLKILQNPIAWHLFNLTFISIYQNFLLLSIASPSFVAYTMATNPSCVGVEGETPLNWMDCVAATLVVLLVVIESIADNQQNQFQTEKYRRINAGMELEGEYKDGFCQSGLFSIVRKPNYAAEQAIWISFYIFSISASGEIFNWSSIGWILLVLLFQGSGALTEKLTLMKYKEYLEYQKRVPLYVPRFYGWPSRRRENSKKQN